MKKIATIIFISLFILIRFNSKAQDKKQITYNSSEEILSKAEQMPEFIGGEKRLFEFISSNLQYPAEAKKNNISGKVYVQFVVDKNGKVRDSKILRGIGGGCDEEVLRVMSLMPDWMPGKNAGKPVSVLYNLPVNFSLKEPEMKKDKE